MVAHYCVRNAGDLWLRFATLIRPRRWAWRCLFTPLWPPRRAEQKKGPREEADRMNPGARSSGWIEHLPSKQRVACSSHAGPAILGCPQCHSFGPASSAHKRTGFPQSIWLIPVVVASANHHCRQLMNPSKSILSNSTTFCKMQMFLSWRISGLHGAGLAGWLRQRSNKQPQTWLATLL